MFEDGFCRHQDYRIPNQRVCQLGKVLCPDLSCRDNHDDCYIGWYKKVNERSCHADQFLSDTKYCSSTTTCKNSTEVVCPGGICIENEIFCPPLTEFADEKLSYLFQNNKCDEEFFSCTNNTVFGHKYSFYEDGESREIC